MKKCNSCNTYLHDLYESCPNCGNTQLVYVQDNNQQPSYNQQPSMMKNSNNTKVEIQQTNNNKFNSFTIASIIFFVIEYVFIWWYGVISLILAIVALFQTIKNIRKSNEKASNNAKIEIMIDISLILVNIEMLLVVFSELKYWF